MRWIIEAICDLLYPRDPALTDVALGWKLAVLGLLAVIITIAVTWN